MKYENRAAVTRSKSDSGRYELATVTIYKLTMFGYPEKFATLSAQSNKNENCFYALTIHLPGYFGAIDFKFIDKLQTLASKMSAPRARLVDGFPRLDECHLDRLIQALKKLNFSIKYFDTTKDHYDWGKYQEDLKAQELTPVPA